MHYTPELATSNAFVNYYDVLGVDQDASHADIKAAYHRLLLAHHPDKRKADTSPDASLSSNTFDFALWKEAYTTLTTPDLREEYDPKLNAILVQKSSAPRPAQVISLDDFDSDEEQGTWWHICRCGGHYRIKEQFLEDGHHLVNCDSCSEVIWVGYEAVEE